MTENMNEMDGRRRWDGLRKTLSKYGELEEKRVLECKGQPTSDL